MTENNMLSMPEDEFDAQIGRYLRWESGQLAGAPTAEEAATRVAGGLVRRRTSVRPALAFAAVALALLLAGMAAFYVGDPNRNLVVVPSPSTETPERSPVAVATPRPSFGPGPCGTGRVEIRGAATGVLPADAEAIDVPDGGRIAMALENEERDGGTIVIAGPDGVEPDIVATFTGEDIPARGGVQVVAWSSDGSLLLVWAGREDFQDPEGHCGNLWTVATDGSAASRVTDNAPGDVADTSAFAPSGSTVAYSQGGVLHVVPTAGDEIKVPFGLCSNGPFPLHWSPDETRILLICGGDDALVIVDLETATHLRVQLPAAALDAAWNSDGTSIVAGVGDQVPGLLGGPLSILDLDPDTGSYSVRLESDGSTEWVLGAPSISPDGRWLLVLGGGDGEPPNTPTFVVETDTGATRIAPFPLLMDFALPENTHVNRPTAIWLEGNDQVLTEDRLTLYEVDLGSLTRTVVGGVPAQDFAWFPLQP